MWKKLKNFVGNRSRESCKVLLPPPKLPMPFPTIVLIVHAVVNVDSDDISTLRVDDVDGRVGGVDEGDFAYNIIVMIRNIKKGCLRINP